MAATRNLFAKLKLAVLDTTTAAFRIPMITTPSRLLTLRTLVLMPGFLSLELNLVMTRVPSDSKLIPRTRWFKV
jgi:hypothetical protein